MYKLFVSSLVIALFYYGCRKAAEIRDFRAIDPVNQLSFLRDWKDSLSVHGQIFQAIFDDEVVFYVDCCCPSIDRDFNPILYNCEGNKIGQLGEVQSNKTGDLQAQIIIYSRPDLDCL